MGKEFLREFGPDIAAVDRITTEWGEGDPKRFARFFREWMPAMELHVQLMVGLILNPKRTSKPQDLWDVEHAALAPVYADAFVTSDGFLRHQLREQRSIAQDRLATILGSAGELEAWLLQCLAVPRSG